MRRNAAHRVESLVRGSVSAVLVVTGENWTDLGAAIGLTTDTVSRRQRGYSLWTIADLGRLADHWQIAASSLIAGPNDALSELQPSRVDSIRSAKGLAAWEGTLPAWVGALAA
ncbi:helix-turn-helix domain-containing protein [Streptomyces sp. NPDC005533]|uniref:helix-turn-helix domain-containing protein n=1 Tax=Streptomyces sp. NPDC005533 TaxID=3364723 RepID=UPI0036B769D1